MELIRDFVRARCFLGLPILILPSRENYMSVYMVVAKTAHHGSRSPTVRGLVSIPKSARNYRNGDLKRTTLWSSSVHKLCSEFS